MIKISFLTITVRFGRFNQMIEVYTLIMLLNTVERDSVVYEFAIFLIFLWYPFFVKTY